MNKAKLKSKKITITVTVSQIEEIVDALNHYARYWEKIKDPNAERLRRRAEYFKSVMIETIAKQEIK